MGFRSYFVATYYDRMMAAAERRCIGQWRAELLSVVAGNVLELGAGTGANLPYYPSSVGELTLAEPDANMRTVLAAKLPNGGRATIVDCPAESLAFDDASFDCIVSTLVLCTVGSQAKTLAEIRRVLKPGGRLFFLEHVGADPGTWTAFFQRMIEPAWRIPSCNCHLTRDTEAAIRAAGFEFGDLQYVEMCAGPSVVRHCILGSASPA